MFVGYSVSVIHKMLCLIFMTMKRVSLLATPLAVANLLGSEKDVARVYTTYTSGSREATVINESGLYSLILRSRKPDAMLKLDEDEKLTLPLVMSGQSRNV